MNTVTLYRPVGQKELDSGPIEVVAEHRSECRDDTLGHRGSGSDQPGPFLAVVHRPPGAAGRSAERRCDGCRTDGRGRLELRGYLGGKSPRWHEALNAAVIGPVNRALITGDATDLPLAKQWLEAMVRLVPYEGGEHLRRLREAQPRLQ